MVNLLSNLIIISKPNINNKMGLIELGPEDSQAFQTRYRIESLSPNTDASSKTKKNWFQRLFHL